MNDVEKKISSFTTLNYYVVRVRVIASGGKCSAWMRHGSTSNEGDARDMIRSDQRRDHSLGGLIDPGGAREYRILRCVETEVEIVK